MKRSLSNLAFKNTNAIQFDSLCEEELSPPKDPIALRRCLQDRFDSECPYSFASYSSYKNETENSTWPSLSSLTLNFHPNPRRMLRSSANKLTKSFGNLRTTIEEISQKFRASTRRRNRLSNSPISPSTPHSRSRKMLGRTPTKLYSPFAIVTPSPNTRRTRYNKENVSTPKRNNITPQQKKLEKAASKKSESQPSENKSVRQKLITKTNERQI